MLILSLLVSGTTWAQTSKKKSKKSKITTKVATTTTQSSETSTSSTSTNNNNSTNKGFDVGGIVNQVGGLLGGGTGTGIGGMTQDKAANGLKEALQLGTSLASNNLGAVDGFLANAAVKILFPPEARRIESTLRSIGMGSVCDDVIKSVNRAAESAVVEAKPIFAAAITQMSITDAISILTGGKDAATNYLRLTSGQALMDKFQPIIKSNLDKANATKYWSTAMNAYNSVPFVQRVNPNLTQFVTEKATDGIFLMVAQEELKIRENPTARIGGILQDVFGWADKNRK